MLRASANTANVTIDLGAIVDPNRSAGPAGADEIIVFTRALVERTPQLDEARDALATRMGPEAAAAVAGSVGNFEMMNRLLDATGIPRPGSMADLGTYLTA